VFGVWIHSCLDVVDAVFDLCAHRTAVYCSANVVLNVRGKPEPLTVISNLCCVESDDVSMVGENVIPPPNKFSSLINKGLLATLTPVVFHNVA